MDAPVTADGRTLLSQAVGLASQACSRLLHSGPTFLFFFSSRSGVYNMLVTSEHSSCAQLGSWLLGTPGEARSSPYVERRRQKRSNLGLNKVGCKDCSNNGSFCVICNRCVTSSVNCTLYVMGG